MRWAVAGAALIQLGFAVWLLGALSGANQGQALSEGVGGIGSTGHIVTAWAGVDIVVVVALVVVHRLVAR
jgi:hypothetical protein